MLVKLVVSNLALIDYLDLDWQSGLVVLTGETGAGKSLVLDALSLILGYRAATDLIRLGREKASVQAVFESVQLPEEFAALSEGGQLIISREVGQNGRSVAKVNGQLVTMGQLRSLGAALVDLHGQHEHQSLLAVEKHLQVLDRFGGATVASHLTAVAQLAERHQALSRELAGLLGDDRERERRLDMLRFQRDEIAAAKLVVGEEERLASERRLLANYEKLFAATSHAYRLLYQGENRQAAASEQLGEALAELETAARYDQQLAALGELLQTSLYGIEDASRSLRDYLDGLAHDPGRLEQIESRLDQINRMKRKYGESTARVLEFAAQTTAEIDRIENSEQQIELLRQEQAMVQRQYRQEAQTLSGLRQQAALQLAAAVQRELADLGLPDAQFSISVQPQPEQKPSRQGCDQVEFLFTANPGDIPRPLVRVISGGEMSRVMLALKSVLAADDSIDTLVFDEIDVGLGGRVAVAVGEKLRQLAASHQVICISHLANIASMAEQHLLISKHVEAGETFTRVQALTPELRVQEIARLLDGEASPIAYQHARELLQQAQKST